MAKLQTTLPAMALFIFCLVNTPQAMSLQFVDDMNFPPDKVVGGTAFNGLSGLVQADQHRFFIVSDDRSIHNHARFYSVSITVEDELVVIPDTVTYLKNPDGNFFTQHTVDFEGIIILENTNLLLSNEGAPNLGINPSLTEFRQDGTFVKNWQVPSIFIVDRQKNYGVRNNQALESLTSTPDKQSIFTANEQALHQDGDKAGIANGSPVRIVQYDRHGEILGQYPYMVSPIPNPTGLSSVQGDNGLVEMLALDRHNLLTLERSYVASLNRVFVRIFHINLEHAHDISHSSSLSDKIAKVPFVAKALVLDFETIIPLLEDGYRSLDNLEGMSLGPPLADGSQTLIVVSDGNFNREQRTLFLAFKLLPD